MVDTTYPTQDTGGVNVHSLGVDSNINIALQCCQYQLKQLALCW